MAGIKINLWLNHQQRALLERAIADGVAPTLEALIKRAIAESEPVPTGRTEVK